MTVWRRSVPIHRQYKSLCLSDAYRSNHAPIGCAASSTSLQLQEANSRDDERATSIAGAPTMKNCNA